MLINSASVNPTSHLNSSALEGNLAGGVSSISVKDILQNSNIFGGKVSHSLGAPMLTSPSIDLSEISTFTVRDFLSKGAEGANLEQDLNALSNSFADQANKMLQTSMTESRVGAGQYFAIGGMSSTAVALLAAANNLMLALNTADTKLSGKLSLVSFSAAQTTARSMEREGMSMLSGNISQSALQMGITGVGAKLEHKGIQNERGAIKNNATKLDKLNAESHSIRDVLNGQNKVKLGAEGVDTTKSLDFKSRQNSAQNLSDANFKSNVESGAVDSLNLKDSNKQLSPEHQAILSRRLEAVESDIRIENSALDSNRIKAREQQMTGDMIMKNSMVVGGIAGASGQYTATLERSEQQISNISNRIAGTASDDTRESGRKSTNLIQEMLRAIESINQSKAAAMSAVAGNIRA